MSSAPRSPYPRPRDAARAARFANDAAILYGCLVNQRARREDSPPRGVLEPLEHTAFDGIPYYDHELDVPQSVAHGSVTVGLGAVLQLVADEAGCSYLSDNPIWYLHPETDEQRAYYGDCVLGKAVDLSRIMATDLLWVMEVVSTNDRRKELKDTRFQKLLNEYNAVPEFALAFPELGDPRALTWCRLVDGVYQEHIVGPGASVHSDTVPGLELRVLPREQWTPGYKFDVYYRGELRPRYAGEHERAEQEKNRAEQEKNRAEQEKNRANDAEARAEQEKARAEQEKNRADDAEARAQRLAARLAELGETLD